MIRFEWDPGKARTNQRKHGISFEDAMHVFDDPYALSSRIGLTKLGNCAGRRSVLPEV